MPNLVTICSVLFANTSKMGQIEIVSKATRMTGASDVIALEALGFFASQFASGGRNSAIFESEVSAQKRETGNTCRSA